MSNVVTKIIKKSKELQKKEKSINKEKRKNEVIDQFKQLSIINS